MEEQSNEVLDVVRICAEGMTASFRYPHFLIGRQPTFPMPPPSTIYGLIAGALGEYPDPQTLRFAYHFTCEKQRVDDVETIWFVSPNKSTRGASKDFNLDATSNVLPREWLIRPRLILYISGADITAIFKAFREPRYVPTLGRSQDIVSYRTVDRIQLNRSWKGRFDSTLLPRSFFTRLREVPAVHMPRFIHPQNRWQVDWAWYLTLERSVDVGKDKHFQSQASDEFWADEETIDKDDGRRRLLYFHSFID